MRKLLPLSFLLLVVMLLVPGSAMADLLTPIQIDTVTWEIIVNRPADKAIGGFDILVGFDPAFSPISISPGNFLGNPAADESLFLVTPGASEFDVWMVSFWSNAVLIGSQPLSFTLFTLTFDNPGNQALHVIQADLSDGFGNPIVEGQIPEPGTMLLLGSGLAALARWRKRLI